MKLVNVREAKAHLSRLLEEVGQGREVIIARAGKPIARLVPLASKRPVRRPGFLRGEIYIAEDFDESLPDGVQASFEEDL